MSVLAEKDCITPGQLDFDGGKLSGPVVSDVSPDTKLQVLLVSLLALVLLLTQFIFRDIDDNRLLSWLWVMDKQQILAILSVSVVGLVAIYKSCLVNLSQKGELLLLLGVTTVLSVATLATPEFMVDSGRYFTHAKLFATHGIGYFLSEWGYGINAWTDMPLASVIYGTVFYLFGESRLAIQFVNICLFSGSIFITFLIGKQLWDAKTGIIAAWLLLATPFLHAQVSQMLVDIPAMFFTILAVYLSTIAVKKSGNGILLLAACAIVFAVLTKYSVWIGLVPVALLPFAFKGQARTVVCKRLLTLALISAVLFLFVFYVHHPILLKQLRILLDYQLPAFQRWQESYVSTFFYQIHPFVTLAALVSVYFAIKKKEFAYLIPVSAVCVMLLMGVYRARYFIIVFPLLALVAAFGIKNIGNVVLQRFIIRSAVFISIAVTLVANQNFLQQTSSVNLSDAGRYINSLQGNSIGTIVLPQADTVVNPEITLPILDYYTDKKLIQIDVNLDDRTDSSNNSALSPVRFTWEVADYQYQKVDLSQLHRLPVIVLISANKNPKLPANLQSVLDRSYLRSEAFAVTDNVFRFQSVVTIYQHKTNNV